MRRWLQRCRKIFSIACRPGPRTDRTSSTFSFFASRTQGMRPMIRTCLPNERSVDSRRFTVAGARSRPVPVVAIIRASKNRDEAKLRLIERFGFSDKQVDAILTALRGSAAA